MAKITVPEITAMSDQAIDWIILLHSGQATAQETKNAKQWRARSPAHEKAYVEAELLWLDMGDVIQQQMPPVDVTADVIHIKNSPVSGFQKYISISLAAVAMLLILILPLSRYTDQWQSDYFTEVGSQKTITLADGSTVWLNTDSAFSVNYSNHNRQINLHRGQAIFSVTPDPQRPFEVFTEYAMVRALGTVFEVWEQDDKTQVTVLEHAVSLNPLVNGDKQNSVRIETGQQSIYNSSTEKYHTSAVNIKQSAAWQRGKLIFKNQPLADVIAELERYLPGRVLISQQKIRELKVSGVFPLQSPEQLLTMIEQILPVKITQLSPWLTLLHE